MAAKDELGRRGETLAAESLERAGLTLIERNWRCRQGEIDIVARDGDEVVFVEVKTRSSVAYGHPFEAITTRKLARMRLLASAWCVAHEPRPRRIRIDVVSVIAGRGVDPVIEHLRQVF